MSADRVLIVAGEASGDLHEARLLSELRTVRTEIEAFGLGGDELQAAGLESVGHSREIAVVGITEVLSVLRRARELFQAILSAVDTKRPDLAILIDSPEFNLRLAKELARRGVRVAYYVSPQIWAWRRGRVDEISRNVDRMLVLFPFEVAFYEEHEIDVVHVGHPLVDEVPTTKQAWDTEPAPEHYRISLLPGSRNSELKRLLPLMLQAAREIGTRHPISTRLIAAPTVDPETLRSAAVEEGVEVEIITEGRYSVLADSHLALCASGTAALEVGLLETPMIVVYRVGRGSALLGRFLVDLPHFSLVNLVSGKAAVPELYQGDATVPRIVAEADRLLSDPVAIVRMRRDLRELRQRLGEGGASRRAAEQVASMLPVTHTAPAEPAGGGEGA